MGTAASTPRAECSSSGLTSQGESDARFPTVPAARQGQGGHLRGLRGLAGSLVGARAWFPRVTRVRLKPPQCDYKHLGLWVETESLFRLECQPEMREPTHSLRAPGLAGR